MHHLDRVHPRAEVIISASVIKSKEEKKKKERPAFPKNVHAHCASSITITTYSVCAIYYAIALRITNNAYTQRNRPVCTMLLTLFFHLASN